MPLVSVSFHQSCPSFDGIRSIDSTSLQVLLSKEYFLWSSLQWFDKSFVSRHFCWYVSDVNSFHREYRLNTPTFLWDYSHIFSPRVVNFSLGSLSTNWKYPHSQSASWNDFRGPSVQELPHPLHVSFAPARSLFHPLVPSACYAGYSYPYGSNNIAFTPEDFHKIWVFLPKEYGSTMKNFVEFKASPPTTPCQRNSFIFYSTPKQIFIFFNLPLKNSIGPQPGVKDVKCSSLFILFL